MSENEDKMLLGIGVDDLDLKIYSGVDGTGQKYMILETPGWDVVGSAPGERHRFKRISDLYPENDYNPEGLAPFVSVRGREQIAPAPKETDLVWCIQCLKYRDGNVSFANNVALVCEVCDSVIRWAHVECPTCGGHGFDVDTQMHCDFCEGSGKVKA